jgi:hypothetical protein
MSASVRELLTDSLALAEAQLEAARTLDIDALTESSEARQAILLELEQVDPNQVRSDPELEELVLQNQEIDERLMVVLEGATAAFRAVTAGDGPSVYNASGQLRGGAP